VFVAVDESIHSRRDVDVVVRRLSRLSDKGLKPYPYSDNVAYCYRTVATSKYVVV
jgi:hypothetical protein